MVVPDREASCSLVESCPVEPIREYRRKNPDHVIVSYINTSIEVKAESDILCTSRNAVKVVNSIPPERPVLFLPDVNLGNYVKRQTGRENMKIWQGACIVHATFPARRVAEARLEHPEAVVVAHPECPESVLAMADFIGSTSAIIEYCAHEQRPRVYRDDGERGEPLADPGGAGQEVLLRGQRELQLQRVPVHEAQYAGEAARLSSHAGTAGGTAGRHHDPRPGAAGAHARAEIMLTDSFGRIHDNLRISVTDRCNIRCFYCMPEHDVQFVKRSEILDFEEIERFARIAAGLGVTKLRVTGGEPLVRRDLPVLIERLAAIPGIRDLALTTNGVLLPELAAPLYEAGLRRINVHIDTLDRERFLRDHAPGRFAEGAAGPGNRQGTRVSRSS